MRIGPPELNLRRGLARHGEHRPRDVHADHRRSTALAGSGDGPCPGRHVEQPSASLHVRKLHQPLHAAGERWVEKPRVLSGMLVVGRLADTQRRRGPIAPRHSAIFPPRPRRSRGVAPRRRAREPRSQASPHRIWVAHRLDDRDQPVALLLDAGGQPDDSRERLPPVNQREIDRPSLAVGAQVSAAQQSPSQRVEPLDDKGRVARRLPDLEDQEGPLALNARPEIARSRVSERLLIAQNGSETGGPHIPRDLARRAGRPIGCVV
jgi:hypothetical protein